MTHWVIAPLLVPLIGGLLQLAFRKRGFPFQRILGAAAMAAFLMVAVRVLLLASTGETFVYSLGSWPAPYGIVLVLDRLSAWMVLITALLACAAFAYACVRKVDEQGIHFHSLYQLQLFGLSGAFLTGDVFNLFVFFEVLLLASYGLVLHGSGKKRTKAGFHYVVVNLLGSTLYLFAVGALYGAVGTLNIADLAHKISMAPAERSGLIAAAGLLLLVVFSLKAAMFPLYLWLPRAYANTSAPVAALFAVMTKVGVYAIIRVHGTLFGEQAGELAFLHLPWVLIGGLITLVLAAMGAMAARSLREQVAYLVLTSVATLLIAIGLNDPAALSAGLYYLPHSTLVAAAFFLLADLIKDGRGKASDRLETVVRMKGETSLGIGFFIAAVALAGLPPLSGFLGKLMILNAALNHPWAGVILATVLTASLLLLMALVRSGSFLFFRPKQDGEEVETSAGQSPPKAAYAICLGLLAAGPFLVIFAGPITQFTRETADQLQQVPAYIEKVIEMKSGEASQEG